jgi:hypothetical protein
LKRLFDKPLALVVGATLLVGLVATAPAHSSGMIFGVRPGQLLQKAYFGADMGSIVPMVGLDFLSVSVSAEDADISAGVYIPHIGARYYFGGTRTTGNVIPYVEGSLMFSYATADLGGATEYESMVEDILGFWGIGAIFGAEYFFSDRFSVAGEYGLHYLKDSADLNIEDSDIVDAFEAKIDAALKTTYVGAAISFHF